MLIFCTKFCSLFMWYNHHYRDREDSSVSRRSAHSSLVPEVPQSIKRMTIGEYNELVVPLAFTTLIENYEEECPEDEQPEEAADDLSSKGKNWN